MGEQWTVVRYGKKGQRTRQPQGGDWRYGRSAGWKDRAPAFSFGRDAFRVPYPSRPVPPPGTSRYTGPQSRSYAAVVRGTNQRQDRRWWPARAADPGILRQAADPQLGRVVRKLHGVLKMVHHLQNVTPCPGREEPRMITRMVEVLTDMIKPALPTQETLDMISGNARNWGHNTYLILMEHYEKTLAKLLEELPAILTPQWKGAFAVAVRWAKRKWPHITQDSIDKAEAHIVASLNTGEPAGAPVTVQAPQPTGVSVQTGAPQQPVTGVSGNGQASQPTKRTRKGVAVQTDVPQQSVAQVSVATMTEQEAQKSVDWQDTPKVDPPPREQRQVRKKTSTPAHQDTEIQVQEVQQEEEEIIMDTSGQEAQQVEQEVILDTPLQDQTEDSNLGAMFDEMEAEEEERQRALHDSFEDLFEDSFEHFVDPGPQRFKVHRHINTQRKLTDWNLQVEKKVLIIGDSNLATIPDFLNKDIQVESFPGSHFRHAQALMEKTRPPQDLVVEKVVLSFGINSRANKCKETTVKNLQGALRSAKKKFPYAEIWIPLLNFSEDLPDDEKQNLQILNDHIERNMPFIAPLPQDRFQTQEDDIHWTVGTAQAMFGHWMATLNCRAP